MENNYKYNRPYVLLGISVVVPKKLKTPHFEKMIGEYAIDVNGDFWIKIENRVEYMKYTRIDTLTPKNGGH
jgi:hypothetical protein